MKPKTPFDPALPPIWGEPDAARPTSGSPSGEKLEGLTEHHKSACRIRAQFSLRCLLAALSIIAFLLAMLGWRATVLRERVLFREQVERLKHSDFEKLDRIQPSFLDRLVAATFGVDTISYERLVIGDNMDVFVLSRLSELPTVKEVLIRECELSSMAVFQSNNNVQKLGLYHCTIWNLSGIGQLSSVEEVEFHGEGNSLKTFEGISEAPKSLKKLVIWTVPRSDISGLAEFSKLDNLETVVLANPPQSLFDAVCTIPGLRKLTIDTCYNVSNFESLKLASNLSCLELQGAKLNDQSLSCVNTASSLKILKLDGCRIDADQHIQIFGKFLAAGKTGKMTLERPTD